MQTELKNLIEMRQKSLAPDVPDDRWLWPQPDTGGWAGPFSDWESSHRHKYFLHLRSNKTIVTAGANCGAYVRAYAAKFDTVFAFEPDWLNFYCMCYNTPYFNVKKFNAALGNAPGFCTLVDKNKKNCGSYRIKTEAVAEECHIPVMVIDSLKLTSCDMIQLDVEGYEFEALQGGTGTIEKFKPVVVVENHKKNVEEFLFARGYKFQEKSISDYIYYPA